MTEHLDGAVLAVLQDVMEDEYPLLLQTFLSDSQARLSDLERALEARDGEAVRQAAHTFKGSCSNMGAQLMADLCKQLEVQGKAGNLEVVPGLIEQLRREFGIVRFLIESERRQQP